MSSLNRYQLIPEEEFIERHKKFRESSSDDKIKTAEHLYWQIKCLGNHNGMDIPDLYMLILYMKSDLEFKCPQVLELNKQFSLAEHEAKLQEAITELKDTEGN